MSQLLPQPTVPGKVAGIIGMDPLTVQCAECGATASRTTERTGAAFIILCGYRFHLCQSDERRLCPTCFDAETAACLNKGRHA